MHDNARVADSTIPHECVGSNVRARLCRAPANNEKPRRLKPAATSRFQPCGRNRAAREKSLLNEQRLLRGTNVALLQIELGQFDRRWEPSGIRWARVSL